MKRSGGSMLRKTKMPKPGGQAPAMREKRAGFGAKGASKPGMMPGGGLKGPVRKGVMAMKPKKRKKS